MGLADRDYMRERRSYRTPRRIHPAARTFWRFAVMAAILATLFLAFKFALQRRDVVPFPATGNIHWYIAPGGAPTAPLSIAAPQREDENHIVRLDDWETHKPIAMIPIRSGETAALQVPLGRYRVTMATGTYWHGPDKLFARAGGTKEAVHPLEFYLKDGQSVGHRIELESRMNGNMPTRNVGMF